MANGWKLAVILMLAALLPAPARAQFLFFGNKKTPDDPPPAFSSGPAPQEPQFAPDPKSMPKGAPEFCPGPGSEPHTPFVPVEEENRNAFLDYKTAEQPSMLFWVRTDYLNWVFKRPNVASVLVTTDSAPNSFTDFGALGQPNTQILVGPGTYRLGQVQGGRITAGFSPSFFLPIEVSGFALQRNHNLFNESSDGSAGSTLLARPVLASQNAQESVFLGGFPGLASGSIFIDSSTNLWGIEVNAFCNLFDLDAWSMDFYVGYKYQELRESLTFFNNLTALNGLVIPFNATVPGVPEVARWDQFGTRNQFNGGQLALRSSLHCGRVAFIVDTKLGLGGNLDTVSVVGNSAPVNGATPFRGAAESSGGVLAVPSNIGTRSREDFSIAPEIDMNLGFQVHRSVRLFAGISWLYWNNIVRPGDQISSVIDTRQVPSSNFFTGQTVTQPPHPFVRTDFFAYGFNIGVLIGY